MNTNYEGKGVDQLARVINLIKNNPDDRRIIMSAWNPVGMLELFFPILSTLCHKVDIGTVRSHVFLRSVLIFLLIRLHLVIYMIHNALLTVPYDSYDS